jgi:hypothetical protein
MIVKTGTSARWICALAALAVTVTATSAQASVITWTFANGTTPTGDPTTITTSEVTGGTMSLVNPHTSAAMLDNSSASSGYTGASGTYNAAASFNATTGVTATSTGYTFTLTPAANTTLTFTGLSLGQRSTTSGPVALWLYSDQSPSPAASITVNNDSTWHMYQFAPFSLSISGPTTFTLYGTDGSSAASTPNGRIDDMTLTYTASVAAPEPASLAMLGLGGAALLARRRRKPAR